MSDIGMKFSYLNELVPAYTDMFKYTQRETICGHNSLHEH